MVPDCTKMFFCTQRMRIGLRRGLNIRNFALILLLMLLSCAIVREISLYDWTENEKSYSSFETSTTKMFWPTLERRGNPSYMTNYEHNNNVDKSRGEIPIVVITCFKDYFGLQGSKISFEDSKAFRHVSTLLKSIAIATTITARVIILSEKESYLVSLQKFVSNWPYQYRKKLKIEPKILKPTKECFSSNSTKPCLLPKTILHEQLPDEDAVIYVDTDFIFLESPEKLSNNFRHFDELQIIGAPPNNGFYEQIRFFDEADYYYYGNAGINGGILLMNLTRMRNFPHNWTKMVYGICRSYYGRMTMLEQGILNILLGEFPETAFDMDCRWNYNVNYCNNGRICPEAREHGTIFAVHGCSDSFHLPIVRKFTQLFRAYENFDLKDPLAKLNSNLQVEFRNFFTNTSGCKSFPELDKAFLRS